MAYKGTVHRGTPYHHVTDTAHQGIAPGRPREQGTGERGKTMTHTTMEPYRSDTRGYQSDPRSGTPYHSDAGNGPEYKRTVEQSTDAESADHGNQNDPKTNGRGVVFDGANSYERGYSPHSEPTMDSPVPGHAPVFDTRTVREEDRAHVGMRNESAATDDILKIGGVMSRGMRGTSTPEGAEDELIGDDVLRDHYQESVKHEKE